MSESEVKEQPRQYKGPLTPAQAAAAMQASRLNAVELLDTAEILFSLKRFAHSLVFSILAIEEAGKLLLLQCIFLGFGGEIGDLWRDYRSHRAKTRPLNAAIEARIRAGFPGISREEANELRKRGPTPDQLEAFKQRAIYSDCLEAGDNPVCHLPKNVDWRKNAWERLCEAQAIVMAPRDRTPEELAIWLKHAEQARAKGCDFASMREPLHRDLLAEGFVKAGWWDTILADTKEDEAAAAGAKRQPGEA